MVGDGDEVGVWTDLAGGDNDAEAGILNTCEEQLARDPTGPTFRVDATPSGEPAIDFNHFSNFTESLRVPESTEFAGNAATWFVVFQADHVGVNSPTSSRVPRLVSNIVEDVGSRNIHPGFAFEPVFRVSIPAPDGTAFNAEKEMFAVLAESYGLAPEDFGREFNTGHERFQITGIDPKRPKYPISAERIPDRQGFKFTAENVVALLKSQATS